MVKKLQEWFFYPQTATALGVFRALACGLCFLSLAALGFTFEAFYTQRGLWPVEFMQQWGANHPRISILSGATDDRAALAVYLVALAASLLATLGLLTRASLVVLFITLVSLHHRSPDLLNSGDTLMRQWIFLLMIAPCGAGFSLDRLLALRKGAPREVPEISSWPLRLIQIQLAVVYFTTLWHKWYGETWRNGTATSIAGGLREMERFPMPPFWNQQPFIAAETWGTLVIELALATLVFGRPMRGWVLLAGLLLHLGIEYSMNIPFFAGIICAGYIAHYEGWEVEGFARRLPWLRRWAPQENPVADSP